jgi:mono/diheme cytochrome c family protein
MTVPCTKKVRGDEGRLKPAQIFKAACLCLTWALGSGFQAAQSVQAPPRPQPIASSYDQVVSQYCVTCHNQRAKTAGLMLDTMDLAHVADRAEVWEKVVRKLRTGSMPPQGARRPDAATYESLAAWLEAELDRGAAAKPNPGRAILLHRLNRAEYANAIRDLLALDVNVTSLLPPDDSAYGFDNIADALGVSPVLLERYLVAADKVSSLAVGDPDVRPGSDTYRVRQDLSQDQHIEGLPLGTVGGGLFRHTFPVNGEYEFQVKLFRTNSSVMRGLEYPQQLEITVDGVRVYLTTIGGGDDFKTLLKDVTAAGDAVDARLKVRVPIKAGPRDVGVTFLYRSAVADTRQLQPFLRSSVDTYDFTGRPHVDTFTITGPFNAGAPGDTPSRRRIFACRPASPRAGESGSSSKSGAVSASRDTELGCARQIISTLARRAFRRSVTDSDLQPLLDFYRSGRREGSFDSGIQSALQRMLASPLFVFRFEHDPKNVAPGTVYGLDDFEIASQLSFFLWSSIPDDELLAAAEQGRLKVPAVREQQVRRMLADPKSRALVSNFAGQWLQLRNLKGLVPNSEEFSDFDDNLRQAFQIEGEMFFESIMREDRNVLDLMTADYTFVNERLARHYGIPNVYGSHFRRVTLGDDARKGLLGKGGVLMVTSHTDRTSPVSRGKWVLENLLGTPPPPPPANVPPFPDNVGSQKPRSVRERMEQHRGNPSCAACHKLMDPLGFALENFDAVGKWRTRDAGNPIDATGQLTDGTQIDGVVSLRAALSRRPGVFVTTLTEKLLTYALGRGVDYRDMPSVRAIVRESARHNYRFASLVVGIVQSSPFLLRMKASEEAAAAGTAAR